MESLENEDLFKKIYYNIANPGSLSGVDSFLKEIRKYKSDVKPKDVKKWLSSQLVYTLHKPLRRKIKRNPIIAEWPNEQMQADLVDMKLFSNSNNGYNYILTAIDVFSKRANAIPIRNKRKNDVCKAMETIIKNSSPLKLMTDEGLEFKNSDFKKLMKKYNVNHFFAKNKEIKCAIVERFNKTLKNKMFKYFTLKGNRRYIDVISKFLESYNNSYHRSIKMAPNDVNNGNAKQVFKNLYGVKNKRELIRKMRKPNIPLDATVRKKYKLKYLDQGYYPNWTDEIFTVYKSIPGVKQPYYHLKDDKGNIIEKRFYPSEIQKVQPHLYRIEKILAEKKIRGKKYYFVKWLNYNDSENTWIPATNITNIDG